MNIALNTHLFLSEEFFFTVKISVLRAKDYCLQVWVDILPHVSGSVEPHIYWVPNPGSQNVANPTDPAPKHKPLYIWLNLI